MEFSLPLILDGATGTNLTARGMKPGECTERFVLENPGIFAGLQSEYIEAGSDAVLTPTFGANIPTLIRHGFTEEEADSTVKALAEISLSHRDRRRRLVGGDIAPTGLLIRPFGDAEPSEVEGYFRAQAKSLIEAGVDFIDIETMISADEARLAVRGVRSVSADIPVFVTLTVDENGRTMNGDTPAAALAVISQYGIQGFGCNCSVGPDVVYNALKPASELALSLGIPLIAKPNAGMPEERDGGTFFPLTPEDMSAFVGKFFEIGAYILGGCCGTTPAHIKAIADAAHSLQVPALTPRPVMLAATSRVYMEIEEEGDYVFIDSDSEDDIYDLLEEEDGVLFFELGEGAADLLISMDAFIPNPYRVKGNAEEIGKIKAALCRRVD